MKSSQLKEFATPGLRWRRPLSMTYLVTGLLVLLVVVEGALEDLGVLASPAEQTLPEWLYTLLVITMFIVGLLLVFGWPITLVILVLYRHDRLVMLPAAVFLVADILFLMDILLGQQTNWLLLAGGIALALYGVAAFTIAIHLYRRG